MVEASPAEVVARINRLVMSGVEQVMATVLYLVLDRETGRSFSAAGHPPLVIAPGGPRYLEGGRSVPIGAADPAVFREATAILQPGSSLLLYTDGLVERRDTPLEERLDQLAAAVRDAGTDLNGSARTCSRPCSATRIRATTSRCSRSGPCPRSTPTSASRCPPSPARWPSSGAAGALPARDRRDEVEQYEITLTICEAAGNAIEHAYGRATRPTRSRWSSTPASSPPACATPAAGARSAASTAGAGSASSRTSWTR